MSAIHFFGEAYTSMIFCKMQFLWRLSDTDRFRESNTQDNEFVLFLCTHQHYKIWRLFFYKIFMVL